MIRSFTALLFILIPLALADSLLAHELEANIRVWPAKVEIEGKFIGKPSFSPGKNWSFMESYADADNLGARVSSINLFDEQKKNIGVKQFIEGEWLANYPASSFRYDVKTGVPEKITSAAHISWVSENHGMVMLGDLFPQWQTSENQQIQAKISFELPPGWKILSNEQKLSESSFFVNDISKAVFLVGRGWREKRAWIGKNELNFAIIGDWKFTDDEAIQIASQILQEHQRTFGEAASAKSQVFLMPFPKGSFTENWRAETRGTTVTIISGVMPFKQQGLQRLHEQLRHELLHFWLPNSLALSGSYDWFYEGFTIYQALRNGIELNYLRFDDYLYTLSKTYEFARAFDREDQTLIEASNNRWRGSTNLIYNKGFITAFLCDLAIIKESKGKRNVSDIFRAIWRKHKTGAPYQDGNQAILAVLRSYPELSGIIERFIEGKSKIEIKDELAPFGLEIIPKQFGAEIAITPKLNGKQRDLLDKLGYNQWRKLLTQKR